MKRAFVLALLTISLVVIVARSRDTCSLAFGPLQAEPTPSPSATDFLPLQPGVTWVYTAQIAYQEMTEIITYTGLITVEVTDVITHSNAITAHLYQTGHPLWQELDRHFYYVAAGQKVYRAYGDEQVERILQDPEDPNLWPEYVFPMQVGDEWGSADMLARKDGFYVWRVEAQENITVPAGCFTDCYQLALWTLPDDTHIGFCPGTGMVSYKYHHHGSVHDGEWRLESFEQIISSSQIIDKARGRGEDDQ